MLVNVLNLAVPIKIKDVVKSNCFCKRPVCTIVGEASTSASISTNIALGSSVSAKSPISPAGLIRAEYTTLELPVQSVYPSF